MSQHIRLEFTPRQPLLMAVYSLCNVLPMLSRIIWEQIVPLKH